MDDAPSRIPAPDADRIVTPNFVTAIVDDDLTHDRVDTIVTRFPPEPNGYLHIGHAKAICLDFGVAEDYHGRTNLRFDDTNPTTEDPEYVEAIQRDVAWLGFQWSEKRYASDYFDQLYHLALRLIRMGDAYVDSQSEDAIREGRGTVTQPGVPSPYRDRSVEENVDLFQRMRAGEFADGAHVLRAKIDMTAKNMIMRDPVLYRIRRAHHYRTGDAWPIYPLYDFAHPLSDAIEGVTHSLCTLEFVNNREIYDWLVERLFDPPRPHQYEFSRLALDHTVVSKRKLLRLVQGGFVDGWDDPRMPTLAALRRRGYTPEAIRAFVNLVGVTKTNARTDLGLLEAAVRDDLNQQAPRVMAVLDPIPLDIAGLATDAIGDHDAPLWPHDVPRDGTRPLPLEARVWIERNDAQLDPPKGWKRFAPGVAVRLRHGPVVQCDRVEVDASGSVTHVAGHVVDPETRDVKVAGVVHWLARSTAQPAEFRLVDRLFTDPDPEMGDGDITEKVNPDSLRVVHGYVEPYVAQADPATRWQFERQGYFWRDPIDGRGDDLVFTRIVTLKDGWARKEPQQPTLTKKAPTPAPSMQPPQGRERDKAAALDAEGTARLARLEALGVPRGDAVRIAEDGALATWWFEAQQAAPELNAATLANWTVNELPRGLGNVPLSDAALTPATFADLVTLVADGTIAATVAKGLLPELVTQGGAPATIVAERGLGRLDDDAALAQHVAAVLDAHPDEVASYLAGKEGLAGFFVGQVMRATQGRADPAAVQATVRDALAARR